MIERFPDLPDSYDPTNPWLSDELNREEHVKPIERLVLSVRNKPFILTVGAPWGTGKSMLLRMWHDSLTLRNHPCILFDAWTTDFADDPFVAFTEEMTSQLRALKVDKKIKASITTVGNTLRKKALPLAMWGAKAAVKTLLPQFVNVDGICEALKKQGIDSEKLDIASLTECLLASEASYNVLEDFKAQKGHLSDFKKQLSNYVKNLEEKGLSLPLVVFVDELDRCRPDYAVRLLERIKHLFGIPGIVFVLAMDRRHLQASINHLYGHSTDADAYLRRFIDLHYRLPEPSTKRFVNYLWKSFGIDNLPNHPDKTDFKSVLTSIFTLYGLGLRDMAQVFSQLTAVIRGYSPSFDELAMVAVLQSVSKGYPDQYEALVQNKLKGLWSIAYDSGRQKIHGLPLLNVIAEPWQAYFEAIGCRLALTGKNIDQLIRDRQNGAKSNSDNKTKTMFQDAANVAIRVKELNLNIKQVVALTEFAMNFNNNPAEQ